MSTTFANVTEAHAAFSKGSISKIDFVEFAAKAPRVDLLSSMAVIGNDLTLEALNRAEKLAAERAVAAARPAQKLYCKVSEKGACSVYGLQRMPVTLYVEQWERLMAFADELKTFLAANKGKLTLKADKVKS